MKSSIECGGNNNNVSILFQKNNFRKSTDPLVAGYMAGVSGVLVGHPLDSMKVLLQTGTSGGIPKYYPTTKTTQISTTKTTTSVGHAAPTNSVTNQSSTSTTGVSPARTLTIGTNQASMSNSSLLNTTGNRSFMSLYAGVSVPLITVGMVASINFAIYDTIRRIMYTHQHRDDSLTNNKSYLYNDDLMNVCVSATSAGVVVSFITSPLMVVKTKQQVMLWSMKKAAQDTLIHQGGFRNFYAGFGPHLFCDAVGRGVYLTSYEYFKRLCIKRNKETQTSVSFNQDPSQHISLLERATCASVAGMCCWAAIYPFDVIRSKVYAEAALLPTKVGAPRVKVIIKDIWLKGGTRAFFKGFIITVIRAGPVAAAVLPLYDMSLDWLQSM